MIMRTRKLGELKVFEMSREQILDEIWRLQATKGVRFPLNITRFLVTLDAEGKPIIEPVRGRQLD